MPHKHTRRKGAGDSSTFNLPPSALAKPLPVGKGSGNGIAQKRRKDPKASSSDAYGVDDTPKAFQRLMAFSQTRPRRSGLDDGAPPPNKRRKQDKGNGKEPNPKSRSEKDTSKPALAEKLTIQPHEKLSDFAARVNQAIPVAGLARKGKSEEMGRITKHEKHLRRLQTGWREEEARLREREEEEKDLNQEDLVEEAALWEEYGDSGVKGKRKRGKDAHNDDDWAVLKQKRDAPKGVWDVAQAPPSLKNIPREIFKVRNGAKVQVAHIPNKSGSLKRREDLGETRKSVIEQYRKIAREKRNDR